ncbi:MAG: hypothetical protein JSS81_23840 [Acidobacteria bacterium]|nr:hypothetical protein [Acidobacteriota bacterium]
MKYGLLILLVAALAPAVCGQRKTPPRTTELFGRNLIKNGDAESGSADGWTNADELKTIVYGEYGGGPTRESPGPATRGDKYFYARTTTEQPTAVFTQKADVGEIGDAIDKGNVAYDFGGWFGVANGSSSAGRLIVSFFDRDGRKLATAATAEIKEAERPADEVLVEMRQNGRLPAGTRRIEIALEFKIFPGHDEHLDNLAFADDLSLILTNKGAN